VTYPNTSTVIYNHDPNSNRIKIVDPAATSYTYDPRNNVTNEKYISASKYMTIYSYDNTRMLCNVEAGHE